MLYVRFYQFLAHLYESTGNFCCYSDIGVGVDMGITKVLRKSFFI